MNIQWKSIPVAFFVMAMFCTPLVIAEEAPKSSGPKQVLKHKMTLNFQATPLVDVLAFYRQITRANIVVDPRVKLKGKKVSLRLKDIAFKNALTLSLIGHKLKFTWKYGVIYIYRNKDKFGDIGYSKFPKKKLKKKLSTKLTLNFRDTKLSRVVQFFRDVTGAPIVVDPKVSLDKLAPVNLQVKNLELGKIWKIVLLPRGLTVKYKNEVMYITKRAKKKSGKSDKSDKTGKSGK